MNMKKILSTILIAILIISALAGCRGNGVMPGLAPPTAQSEAPPFQNSVDNSLAGKYFLASWEDEDGDYLTRLISEGLRPESVYLELRNDGTYTWDLSALGMGIDIGTYRIADGTTLVLTYDGGEDVLAITDGRLCFEAQNDILVFDKTGLASAAQIATPSPVSARVERWALSYWRETGGSYTNVYSDQLREQGIDTNDIYFEFRSDGTFMLNLSRAPDYKGIVLVGSYRVDDKEDRIIFQWEKNKGAEGFFYPDSASLIDDGDWFGITLPTSTDKGAQASFKKVLPTPPFSFKEGLPASACGMYALKSWTTKKGYDYVDEFLLDDIRSDLLYIDFMADGRLLLSLHAAYPGFFAWGTYWLEDDDIIIEWLEEWDASYFPHGATYNGGTVTLANSDGEKLEFVKEYSGGFPTSSVSYSDGYFGSPLGSAKTLDGTVLVVSIFVRNDNNSLWNDELLAGFRKILRYSMLYLEELADYYDTPLRFYQYQTETGADDLFYMMDLDGWLAGGDDSDEQIVGTRRDIDSFIESNIPYRELADKYHTNNITYVVFTTEVDRSYAWPYYADKSYSAADERYHEKSIVFLDTGYTLIHEILHTFGAVDFYPEEGGQANRDFFGVSEELMDYIEKYYPQEVMVRTRVSEPQLSPLTAYLLGWLDSTP